MSHVGGPGIATIESAAVLDHTVLQELLDSLNNPAAVAAVYRKFVGNAAIFITELSGQDPATRLDTLHTLKGSAAMMGAKRLAEVAAHLQAQGSSIEVGEAARTLAGELTNFRSVIAARLLALGVPADFDE